LGTIRSIRASFMLTAPPIRCPALRRFRLAGGGIAIDTGYHPPTAPASSSARSNGPALSATFISERALPGADAIK
jgi:hypothetical protein